MITEFDYLIHGALIFAAGLATGLLGSLLITSRRSRRSRRHNNLVDDDDYDDDDNYETHPEHRLAPVPAQSPTILTTVIDEADDGTPVLVAPVRENPLERSEPVLAPEVSPERLRRSLLAGGSATLEDHRKAS